MREKTEQQLLETAISLAVTMHAGQVDKGGAPYILHPLRVMMAVKPLDAKIVAVLHDVLEDCPAFTADRLTAAGFPAEIVTALQVLTRWRGEDYSAFIQRCSQNRLARLVKLADLADNADLGRIPNPSPADHKRREKYARAYWTLAGVKLPEAALAQSESR